MYRFPVLPQLVLDMGCAKFSHIIHGSSVVLWPGAFSSLQPILIECTMSMYLLTSGNHHVWSLYDNRLLKYRGTHILHITKPDSFLSVIMLLSMHVGF